MEYAPVAGGMIVFAVTGGCENGRGLGGSIFFRPVVSRNSSSWRSPPGPGSVQRIVVMAKATLLSAKTVIEEMSMMTGSPVQEKNSSQVFL